MLTPLTQGRLPRRLRGLQLRRRGLDRGRQRRHARLPSMRQGRRGACLRVEHDELERAHHDVSRYSDHDDCNLSPCFRHSSPARND
jgi:hypothetical protein